MKVSRSLLAAMLVSTVAALMLIGCSENGATLAPTQKEQTGSVRVLFTNSGSLPMSRATQQQMPLLFNQILLVAGQSDVTNPVPDLDDLLSPNFIKLVHEPTVVDLLHNGGSQQFTQAAISTVPAGLYHQLTLVLDQGSAAIAEDSDLPFTPSQLTALIPIIGGMQVNPKENVILLIDLFTKKARVLNSSDFNFSDLLNL